jgi:hypothetical protein
MSESSNNHTHFGERFYFYSRRVQKLSLYNFTKLRPVERIVSRSVLSAWASRWETPKLFPRLRDLSGSSDYDCRPADARIALRVVTPDIQQFYMMCPLDLVLDTSERERLRTAGSGLRHLTIFAPWLRPSDAAPQLLSVLLRASSHLEHVDAATVSISSPDVLYLAECAKLTTVCLQPGSAHTNLPPHAFHLLTRLQMCEATDELYSLRFCLALSSNIPLLDFSYRTSTTKKVAYDALHQLASCIARWNTLVSVSLLVTTREEEPMLLEDSRTFYSRFHALAGLHTLICNTSEAIILDFALIEGFLDACPRLVTWSAQSYRVRAQFGRPISFELSLLELLHLLFYHSSVLELPVCVRCDELPESDIIGYFEGNAYGHQLYVNNVIDPAEVAEVLYQVLPCVTACTWGVGADTPVDETQFSAIKELNTLLKEFKASDT